MRQAWRAWNVGAWAVLGLWSIGVPTWAQIPDNAAQELLRQQERERAARAMEAPPDERLPRPVPALPGRLPQHEQPCFPIAQIRLDGEEAERFHWALREGDPADDRATGRCLGSAGINVVMARIQNAIIARGFVTTRILARPQDLKTGTLVLTVVPGRIRDIRYAPGTSLKATAWNAVPRGAASCSTCATSSRRWRISSASPPWKPTSRSFPPKARCPARRQRPRHRLAATFLSGTDKRHAGRLRQQDHRQAAGRHHGLAR